MKITVFTISYNEGYMMPFFLRHYSAFADKIVVWDEHSTDGTREAVKACKRAELRDWPYKGLDDESFRFVQSHWYRDSDSDWVMWPDVDELLVHSDWRTSLWASKQCGINAITTPGFNMVPDAPPVDDGRSQFYDLCNLGIPSENYTKTIIFSPRLKIDFDYGRHKICRAEGLRAHQFGKLLHCHFLGLDYLTARNQRNYDRALDKRFAWNYAPKHNKATQPGTPEWFKWVVASGQRVSVDARA